MIPLQRLPDRPGPGPFYQHYRVHSNYPAVRRISNCLNLELLHLSIHYQQFLCGLNVYSGHDIATVG